jgi:hypothetical protein
MMQRDNLNAALLLTPGFLLLVGVLSACVESPANSDGPIVVDAPLPAPDLADSFIPTNDNQIVDVAPSPDVATQSNCLKRPLLSVISGAHTAQYKGSPANGASVDARKATWSMINGWLATPKTSVNVCWVGGIFELTVDDKSMSPTKAWSDIWHHNGGWTLKNNNTGWIFDGVTVRHVGDAFNISQGGQDFTIRHSHISDVRDDCVQNDYMHAGVVHNNFFDGCYVGFSARASGGADDGHLNTWTIRDNLVWIKPMYSVYKADSPGNGQIIKWEQVAPQNAPKLVFKGNFVRVGKTPFQVGTKQGEAFFFPPGTIFSGNTLYWDGPGKAPSSLQTWFSSAHNSKIVYTSTEWTAAVKSWWQAHPEVK